MKILRATFFAGWRKQFGTLTQGQVDGLNLILDEWERRGLTNIKHLAYILATAYHETATRMEAVIETRGPKEASNPSVDEAIRRLERAWAAGKLSWVRTPYWRKDENGRSWLGRGLVQLTHKANYAKMTKLIAGVDLVANPSLALNPAVAVKIMFVGMLLGTFTGKALDDFDGPGSEFNALGARAIINGTESKAKVAEQYRKALLALLPAVSDKPADPPPIPKDIAPAPAAQPGGFFVSALRRLFGRTA